jgi:hypothetical protein
MILRVPASGKAFLIADPTAVPTAGTALITKTALDAAVTSAITGGSLMPTAGTVHIAAQTLGCSNGSFNIQTGTTPVNRLTIVNGGAATFTGALTVTGGTTLDSTLVVNNTTTLNQAVTVNSTYNVTSAKEPTTGNHLANKTYVDGAINSISDNVGDIVLKKLLMQYPIRTYTIAPLVDSGTATVHSTSGMADGVPKYFATRHSQGSGRSVSVNVAAGHSIILLYFATSSDTWRTSFSTLGRTITNFLRDPSPIATMLAFRTSSTAMSTTGTFPLVEYGSILNGGVTGATFTICTGTLSNPHTTDLILLKIPS